jgi:hypothetical protein
VTKEGRDVSGLGSREVLVVREVVYVHALQVRSLWRTETKKQRVDLILGVPILISLGANLASVKTFYGWVARVAIVCIHVDECPARHRHQEERSVLLFFFVAPYAGCRSCAQRSHHAQIAGAVRRELWHPDVCERRSMRAGVEAHGADHPFACGWQAGCLAVETMHLSGQTFCCGRKCADHRNHSVGEPVSEVCTDQRWSKSSPGVSDTLGMQRLRLECG